MTGETDDSAVYAQEEIRAIRQMLDADDVIPTCPRCQQRMQQEGPLAGGGSVGLVWRMGCEACNVAAFIAESMSRNRNPETGL